MRTHLTAFSIFVTLFVNAGFVQASTISTSHYTTHSDYKGGYSSQDGDVAAGNIFSYSQSPHSSIAAYDSDKGGQQGKNYGKFSYNDFIVGLSNMNCSKGHDNYDFLAFFKNFFNFGDPVQISSVPLPGALPLFLTGLAALLGLARRKNTREQVNFL